MTDFGMNFGGEARRAHLALVQGGASTISTNSTSAATRALGTDPVARIAAPTTPRIGTGYAAASVESPRSRHEQGVRAVARNFESFEDALLPMVLASGVSGEAAASVAEAIMGNPALKAQAERAFQRARLSAV